MNNLFMPKDGGNIEDLLELGKRNHFVEDDRKAFVFSDQRNLYVKYDLDSEPKLWRGIYAMAMCYDEKMEKLYHSTKGGHIYEAFSNTIIYNGNKNFTSLCMHGAVLYGGTDNGDIYSIDPWSCIHKGRYSDDIVGLDSFKNKLYHGEACDFFETFPQDYMSTMEYDVNYLLPWRDKLYWLSTEGIFNPFTEQRVALNDVDIHCGFIWDEWPFCIDNEGNVWDITAEDEVGKFSDGQVYDVAVVPRNLIRGVP